MFERHQMREDVSVSLTTDQYVAIVMAYEELRDVAMYSRGANPLGRIAARSAARKARRLVAAFGERRATGETRYMAQFRKTVDHVDAIQYDGTRKGRDVIARFVEDDFSTIRMGNALCVFVPTVEGRRQILPDEWIVKDAAGDYHIVNDRRFAAMYEPVSGETT